jgi:hypothetical protein
MPTRLITKRDTSNRMNASESRKAANSWGANNSRDARSSKDVRTAVTPAGHKQQQKLQGRQQEAGSLATAEIPKAIHALKRNDARNCTDALIHEKSW